MDKTGKETLKIMKTVGWYNNWLFSHVSPFLKGKIFEVGAGIGNFTELLAEKGEVWAIDVEKDYINSLEARYGKRIRVGYGDIEKGNYFFKRQNFDTVVCMNVLEHIEDDDRAVKNIYNLLTEGGKLLLLVPAHWFALGTLDKNLGHFRRYSKNELAEKLDKAGFEIKNMRFLNFIGIWGWFLNSRILKKPTLTKNQLKIFNSFSRPFLFIEKYIEAPLGLSILAVAQK